MLSKPAVTTDGHSPLSALWNNTKFAHTLYCIMIW